MFKDIIIGQYVPGNSPGVINTLSTAVKINIQSIGFKPFNIILKGTPLIKINVIV